MRDKLELGDSTHSYKRPHTRGLEISETKRQERFVATQQAVTQTVSSFLQTPTQFDLLESFFEAHLECFADSSNANCIVACFWPANVHAARFKPASSSCEGISPTTMRSPLFPPRRPSALIRYILPGTLLLSCFILYNGLDDRLSARQPMLRWNATAADLATSDYPIDKLIRTAEADFPARLLKVSHSLGDAVAVYRERRRRQPPAEVQGLVPLRAREERDHRGGLLGPDIRRPGTVLGA